MGEIAAVYRLHCARGEVAAAARRIAVEETVEVPDALISPDIEERIVGKVGAVTPAGKEAFDVEIRYDAALAEGQLPQLLNLVYGNASIFRAVRLVDLSLPPEIHGLFRGPNHGVGGLRSLLGVFDRPLLCTALKPRGESRDRLAAIAGDFARGGGDLVKDDHNLVDRSLDAFRERTSRFQQAVEEACAETGRRCLYLANLIAPAEELDERLAHLEAIGAGGAMVAPMLLGLDTVRGLCARHPLLFCSHPTFTGAFYQDPRHGIDPGLLLGRLFRLCGVDISVFTNAGGRFPLTREECAAIARNLRMPLDGIAEGFPAPAGGMTLDRVPEMTREFGRDCVLLIGGDLLAQPEGVRAATERFFARVREQWA